MKKICFLMATPFTLGGEQRVVSIISNLLVNKGYDVSILCTDEITPIDYSIYNLDERIAIKYIPGYSQPKASNLRIKRWNMYVDNLENGTYKNRFLKQKYINCDRYTAKLLINAINTEKYDYVISLSMTYNTMLAVISDKICAKTIGWQHSCSEVYFDTFGKCHYNQEKFTKYMFEKLDAYVVLTKHDQQYLKKKYNVDSIVINNPKSIISDEVTKLNNKRFVTLGRFVKTKNYEKLIDMFYEFHKKNKEWKLYIVGDGELKELLKSKVASYKLGKYVKICNYTTNVEKYYLNSSVYLMSSLYEGWGMVMGEAIEFGLPIISFDISSAKEMIKNNYNGYIVEKYNQDDYVNCMLKLAEDDKLLNKMSVNSKILSNSMSNDYIEKRWLSLFKNLSAVDNSLHSRSFVGAINKKFEKSVFSNLF